MNEEEKVIDESELEGLLEEAKGESVEPVIETEKEETKDAEVEIEIEPENQEEEEEVKSEKESEGVKLEIESGKQIKEDEGVELEVEKKSEVEPVVPEVIPTIHNYEVESKQQSTQAIQPIMPQTGLVAPVCSVEESVRIFKEFEQAKSKVLTGNDILWIGSDGRPDVEGQGSPHIKRSGWRKLARFFGLSWDIENIEKITRERGGYMYKVRVRVWHPAGASVISEGIASSSDSFFTKGGRKDADEENIIMKAQTVAVNRAISDILGSGEVSGEERE